MLNTEEARGPLPPARVLVVDDDVSLRDVLVQFLDDNNVRPVVAASSEEVLRQLRAKPDVVILDLNLGGEDGMDILRMIRSHSDLPVIITTGHRRDEIDRILGLELGADDYVLKPFSLRELLARIRAVVRRRTTLVRPKVTRCSRVRFDRWELDRTTQRLRPDDGEAITLTKSEYALLEAFLNAPGRPLSREHLLRATRIHEDIYDRSIDVQILRLRRKLENKTASPRLIETLRGVGYVLNAAVCVT